MNLKILIATIISLLSTAAFAAPSAVTLYGMGDWGINNPDRALVGQAMAKEAGEPGEAPAAVLLLGDNYYVQLTGVDDPQIQSLFEKTYPADKLNVPFYAILGNHDYRGGDDAIEFAYGATGKSRFTLPARWYRMEFPKDHPLVTVLMLDSNQPLMKPEQWKEESVWLESELAKPHASWLICCAHHDIFGNGSHGDNGVLMTSWGELFKKHHVDLYLCGHEHAMEHIEPTGWPVSFIVSGGGGAGRKGMLRDNRGPYSKSTLGFASLHFDEEKMTAELINEKNEVMHAFERTHDGKVTVTKNSPSDVATTQPLKVIQGVGGKKDGGD